MAFDPIAWLLGYGLKKVTDRLELAFCSSELQKTLNCEVRQWVAGLPPEITLEPEAIFRLSDHSIPESGERRVRIRVATDLQGGKEIGTTDWFECLKEQWREVRDTFQPEDRQSFFNLSPQSAESHLYALAERLHHASDTNPDRFRSVVLQIIESVRTNSERQLERAEANLTLEVHEPVRANYETSPALKLAVVNGGGRMLQLSGLSLEVLGAWENSCLRPADYGAFIREIEIDLTLSPDAGRVPVTHQSLFYKPHDADFFHVRCHSAGGWRYRVRFVGVQKDLLTGESISINSTEFDISFER